MPLRDYYLYSIDLVIDQIKEFNVYIVYSCLLIITEFN